MNEPIQKKRQVPKFLQDLLKLDISATLLFCQKLDKIFPPATYRKHYKVLEISCHGLPWLAVTLASMWILWNESLIQIQTNFFLGLIIDIINISILKALVRRRRPSENHSDMFLTVGPDQYSFPSGHVSRAVYITCFFKQTLPSMFFLHLILLIWAIGVTISRILLRRHHIMDVTGGILLGLTEAWIVISIIWLSKSTSFWILHSLTEEATTLEGLDDQNDIE